MNLFRQIPHNKPTAETVINPRSQKASQEYIAPDFSIIYLTEMQKKEVEIDGTVDMLQYSGTPGRGVFGKWFG